jgi:flagellar biosynthesis protein FlhA
MFIMSGNIAIGLVVFSVLLMVNFLVINKGATRMAEVGARFALDAMPGKQLAIDSDIASGAISHEEGKERRALEQAETTFFGSLDGTSKFVKGDALAGLLITLLNIIVGLAIGIFSHGLTAQDAFSTYAILTVGDGLVSQIPAVLISIATAILLARGGTNGTTDTAISEQLSRHPMALVVVGILLALFAFTPGLPVIPFFGIAASLLLFGIHLLRKPLSTPPATETNELEIDDDRNEDGISSLLEVDDVRIEFSADLTSMILAQGSGIEKRIANIRRHVAVNYGVLLPEIHLTDNQNLSQGQYVIQLMGADAGHYNLETDKHMIITSDQDGIEIDGTPVIEPVYGAPAIWINDADVETATLAGHIVIEPIEIISTHLLEVVKNNLSKIFTFPALQGRLSEMVTLGDQNRSERNRKLIDSLIPDKVPPELLHSVLRSLLSEQISIRNIQLIIEAIAEARPISPSFEVIYDHVRARLAFPILDGLKDSERNVNVVQLAHAWEEIFSEYTIKQSKDSKPLIGLSPERFQSLSNALTNEISIASKTTDKIAVACPDQRRSYIKEILTSSGDKTPVISFSELAHSNHTNVLGVVQP